MEEDNKKYEKGTLGWFREQQKIKAKKYGFDNIDDWLRWKADPFNILEKKYGKEFADWARKNPERGDNWRNKRNQIKREKEWKDDLEIKYGKEFADWAVQNKDKIPNKYLSLGCKTRPEYNNRLAQRAGFKDTSEQIREWRCETGRSGILIEINEDCPLWFGEFAENLMIHTYPGAIKMPSQNPGFDYLWNGIKIDNKGGCLQYRTNSNWSGCNYEIDWNNVADIFILSGWDNRESLNPLFALEFHKNDLVRIGNGSHAHKVEFWKRCSFTVTYTPEGLAQFKEYQIDIDWLKDLCKTTQSNHIMQSPI